MEALRWILLGAGVVFVLIVYLLGRNRRSHTIVSDEFESGSEDLPEFSANDWHDVDGSVSDVHITAREKVDVYLKPDDADSPVYEDGQEDDYQTGLEDEEINEIEQGETDRQDNGDARQADEKNDASPEIIVLTILAKSKEGLQGDKINSVALANKLKFGSMDIYHRMGGDAKPLFSVANMVEPGSFDPVSIHDLRTPGLTFFMQLPAFGGTSHAFSDMLQCAYNVAEVLGAELCDKHRLALTEKEAERLRELAASYDSE